MKAVKISNTLSGVEDDGTIKFLTTLTKESFELLRGEPFPEAYINEAIMFFDRKDLIEERLNKMQDKLNKLEGNVQVLPSYQPYIEKGDESSEVEVTNIVEVEKVAQNKNAANKEDENRDLLLGILGALEEDDKEESR